MVSVQGWNQTRLNLRQIKLIVIHCSDSRYGNAALIKSWHLERGFKSIGYHYVILNGYPGKEDYKNKQPDFQLDGVVEIGRELSRIGAHVKSHNRASVGICLIGRDQFTGQQFKSTAGLIIDIKKDHPQARIIGHSELDNRKTCPNIDMDWLRKLMAEYSRLH